MHYLGGKARYGEEIARVIRSKRKKNQLIREPFCGACWVSQFLEKPLICSDVHLSLILMHQIVQEGWEPPDSVSEEEYQELKEEYQEGREDPLIGFVGFACSWGGKWWGGYARGGPRNYCLENKQSLLKKHEYLKDAIFEHQNYRNLNPENEVIYCDPPYFGTTGYGDFNHTHFWEIMRKWSERNTVIISEYQAPADFKIIWEVEHFSSFDSKPTKERLFQCGQSLKL